MTTAGHPSFTHLEPGTPESHWASCPQRSSCPSVAALLVGVGHLVVVSAHPDDETLGAAGLTAHAHDGGLDVHLVVATDGEGSHPASPTHTPAELAALRATEYDAAARLIAPNAARHRLGLPDGRLADHETVLADALVDVLAGGRTDRPAEAETDDAGANVLLLAPWRGDGHPDHAAAGRAAHAAAHSIGSRVSVLEYPIWLWHWGRAADVPWPQARAFRLSEPQRRRKTAALSEYRSQLVGLSAATGDEPVVSPAMTAHFTRDYEVFFATNT